MEVVEHPRLHREVGEHHGDARFQGALSLDPQVRRALLITFGLAFVSAGVAGVLGALITKAAPVL